MIAYTKCVLFYRERTPPRPQGQRPEPENRGVSIVQVYLHDFVPDQDFPNVLCSCI